MKEMGKMKKIISRCGVALTLLLSPLSQTFAAGFTTGDLRKVDNVAYRGASAYAPENSISAFDKAVEMKADYIEIDAQRSKDGKLVIIHDTTVILQRMVLEKLVN
jgi:glycerophosphoryl diester phosphodiesterase